MSEADRVLVVGDVMTDVIVRPEGPLVRGSDRRAKIESRPGGSGANQAVWLGSMGTKVSFVARVGAKDKRHLEAYFNGFHVDPILVADPQKASGVLVLLVDADGERSFLTVGSFAHEGGKAGSSSWTCPVSTTMATRCGVLDERA